MVDVFHDVMMFKMPMPAKASPVFLALGIDQAHEGQGLTGILPEKIALAD